MPQPCTVCCHEARAAIDAALVAGNVPNRRIAAQHGLAEQAVRRHKAAHLPQRLAEAERARDVADADSLLTKADRLLRAAEHILATTLRAGDHRTALAAVREARGTVEFLAKLRGELNEATSVQVNVLTSPEWRTARAIILEHLAENPELRARIASALASVGREN